MCERLARTRGGQCSRASNVFRRFEVMCGSSNSTILLKVHFFSPPFYYFFFHRTHYFRFACNSTVYESRNLVPCPRLVIAVDPQPRHRALRYFRLAPPSSTSIAAISSCVARARAAGRCTAARPRIVAGIPPVAVAPHIDRLIVGFRGPLASSRPLARPWRTARARAIRRQSTAVPS